MAAAVTLDYGSKVASALAGLTDSKALTLKAREELYRRILRTAPQIAWTVVSPRNIDAFGLHRSNLAALVSCLEKLAGAYDLALVDGFDLRRPDLRSQKVVSGDFRSAAIAAASVVAKVTRDRLMRTLDPAYPAYGFCEHVGYGTPRHRAAILEHGVCELHRTSFAWVGAAMRGEIKRVEDEVPGGENLPDAEALEEAAELE